MRFLMMFDSYASSYEIKNELGAVKSMDGVQNVQLLQRKSGEVPQFCIQVDVEDDQAEAFTRRVQAYRTQFTGYISNAREMSYLLV